MQALKNFLAFLILLLSPCQYLAAEFPYLQIRQYDRSEPAEFTIDMDKYIFGRTEKEFKSKLTKYGFVVLLNAIPSLTIDEMKGLLATTYEYAIDDETLDEADRRNVKNSHISDRVFQKYNQGRSLFDVFDDKLCRLGGYFFSGTFRMNECSHTRRVKPPKLSNLKYFQAPLGVHIDAMYHGPQEFVLNFWTPLEDCGIDKPTLLTFMSGCDDTLSLMKFDAKTFTFDPEVYEKVQQGTAPFLQELPCYYFSVSKGDIVVISNWTLHAGYANEHMEHSRLSMELRISGNSFWYTRY